MEVLDQNQQEEEVKQDNSLLQTEIQRVLKMVSNHTDALLAQGQKLEQEGNKSEILPQKVIQPWIRNVVNDLQIFQFNNEELDQIVEPQESNLQIQGQKFKELEEHRIKINSMTDEVINFSHFVTVDLIQSLAETQQLLEVCKKKRDIKKSQDTNQIQLFKAGAALSKLNLEQGKSPSYMAMDQNEQYLEKQIEQIKTTIEHQLDPVQKLVQKFQFEVQLCGEKLLSAQTAASVKISFKEAIQGENKPFDYIFPSQEFLDQLKQKPFYEVKDLQMTSIFYNYGDSNKKYIFNYKLSDGQESHLYGDIPKSSINFDQTKRPIKTITMHYNDCAIHGFNLYDKEGDQIDKIGLCSGYPTKSIELDDGEKIIGFQGKRWTTERCLMTNFQFITLSQDKSK